MKLSDLSPEILEKIKSVRWDRIIEKHEGPEDWESVLRYYEPEFLEIEGRWVLLPVERSRHRQYHDSAYYLECRWQFADSVSQGYHL
jgi:hypothetical protein